MVQVPRTQSLFSDFGRKSLLIERTSPNVAFEVKVLSNKFAGPRVTPLTLGLKSIEVWRSRGMDLLRDSRFPIITENDETNNVVPSAYTRGKVLQIAST